ncbi:MAG TPA: Trk system potassium transport protein TrkA, partial [Brevundimonas sp.]|nr:Trk system potassium transport protein TrkA [Brevundimonas sp.]
PPGMRIGAVVRAGEAFVPDENTELQIGDQIVALVTYSYLRLAEALLGAPQGRFR